MAEEQGILKYKWQPTEDPRIKVRGEIYWARFVLRGVTVEESLKTKNFKVARSLVERIHARILTDGHKNEIKFTHFKDAWPKFLEDKERGTYTKKGRPRTIREYEEFGQRYFLEFFGPYKIDKITTEVFSEYVTHVQKLKPNLKMFNHQKYMQGFLTWALARDLIAKKPRLYNPDSLRPGAEDEESIGRCITDEEISRFLLNLEGTTKGFQCYFKCALYMGMRSSEITQLKKDRIDWEAGMIRLKKSDTKTKQSRDITIHKIVYPHLKEIFDSNESLFLFPNHCDIDRPMVRDGFGKPWDALRIAAEVKCRFHDLRHTCATKLFSDSKRNPIAICRHLGMSMRVAEKHYIHLHEKDLRSVMEGFAL